MNDTIEISTSGGLDDWGLPIQTPPITVRGRYQYNARRERIATANGDEVVYSADVYMPYHTDVTYDSTITFVDSMGNAISKKPLSIQHKKDVWGSPIMLRVVI